MSYWLSLIFFVPAGCRQSTEESIRLVWTGNQATGISIPPILVEKGQTGVEVFVDSARTPMLGNISTGKDGVVFKPLIPLSPGKQYRVYFQSALIGRITVPIRDSAGAPELLALYPAADTLPDNLLKIYLLFSEPMQEGEALRHISLLDQKGDTIPGIFLDLQPELWNPERTALTVWLDPGRIKRGLIPNERMGNPLQKGARYSLLVDAAWKSAEGLPLRKAFQKNFYVTGRDDNTPSPAQWKITLPPAGTRQSLLINFNEPLDYFLLGETLRIVNEKGLVVPGQIEPDRMQTGCAFHPVRPWVAGTYRLQVATYLEDLAGNNLNKPFDRDITVQQKKEDAFIERTFVLAP